MVVDPELAGIRRGWLTCVMPWIKKFGAGQVQSQRLVRRLWGSEYFLVHIPSALATTAVELLTRMLHPACGVYPLTTSTQL